MRPLACPGLGGPQGQPRARIATATHCNATGQEDGCPIPPAGVRSAHLPTPLAGSTRGGLRLPLTNPTCQKYCCTDFLASGGLRTAEGHPKSTAPPTTLEYHRLRLHTQSPRRFLFETGLSLETASRFMARNCTARNNYMEGGRFWYNIVPSFEASQLLHPQEINLFNSHGRARPLSKCGSRMRLPVGPLTRNLTQKLQRWATAFFWYSGGSIMNAWHTGRFWP